MSALPLWKSGSTRWSGPGGAEESALRAAINRADPAKLHQALSDETLRRIDDFLAGIKAYRDHPYRRALEPAPLVWTEGSTRLFDYGAPGATGIPVLVAPSLINRSYVLDLTPKRSLVRYLAKRGLRPFLIDWGAPGQTERDFGLDDYIAGRLSAALDVVTACAGKPALLGYCMGGLLTLGLAALRPEAVSGQVLMAVPWDFHRPTSLAAQPLSALRAPLERTIEDLGELPGDLLQILFSLQDPGAVERKFRQFSRLNQRHAAARRFVAVEDWANDCVPLTARVTRETFFGWYGENLPGRGLWQVSGTPVQPRKMPHPALVVIPARDRIVPAESARPLADALPNGRRLIIDGGHIGMLTGACAVTELYAPIAGFLGKMKKAD